MIHGVSANQQSFHPVEFGVGLNVVVAERADASSAKDTRNGLGKSTLIDIIDFCLGSRTAKGKALCIKALEDWTFTIDITLAGRRVRATRAVSDPNKIVIDGSTAGWIEQPDGDDLWSDRSLSVDRWRILLGWALFGLARSAERERYRPTYRSMVSYFIRRGLDAYTDTFRHFRVQKPFDIQVNMASLLGLNADYAARWQELKDQGAALNALAQAVKSGAIEGELGTVGELEAERVQLESKTAREQEAIATFRVHPQYEAIQQEADALTAQIHALANENVTDRRRLARYRESVTGEAAPDGSALQRLYAEVGLVFPDAVKATLAEASEFHTRIVSNRRAFLETEINRLEQQVRGRDEDIRGLTETRATALGILSTHGALQEMSKLQRRHLESVGQLDRVTARISDMKNLATRKREIKVALAELTTVAEQDHEQRREKWAVAVRLFNENSQALYEAPGKLVIDVTDKGYDFDVEIERSSSDGVGRMKILCFDLMLLQLMRSQGLMDFLVHDSILYDGVDSRQRAHALELADRVATENGAQYICMLNSDMIPSADFTEGFNFDQHVRLVLNDREPSGSLLGFRFERPSRSREASRRGRSA